MQNPKSLIHFIPRAATITMEAARRKQGVKSSLNWGIPEVDARVDGALPGDVLTFIGRPGMCKTTGLIHLARHWMKELNTAALPVTDRPPLVLFFTLEVHIEDFMTALAAGDSGQSVRDVGKGIADLGKLEAAFIHMFGLNICIAGHAEEDYGNADFKRADFFPSIYDLNEIIIELREQGYYVAGVFIDYLQYLGDEKNMPVTEGRTEAVGLNMMMCKALAMRHRTVFAVAVQARREVDGYAGLKLPKITDGQYSSAIEQSSNKVFGLTMPGKYLDIGEVFELNKLDYEVTDKTLVLQTLKQRNGFATSSDIFVLEVDLPTATLCAAVPVGASNTNLTY